MDTINEFESCLEKNNKNIFNVVYDVKKTYKEIFLIEINEVNKKDGGSVKNRNNLANVIVFN